MATAICRKNKHPFSHFPTKMFSIWKKYGAKAERVLKGVNVYTQNTLPHVSASFNEQFHLRGKVCHCS